MTTVVLSPLRKQGDVSKVPAAPIAVLLQGSNAPPTATTPRTQDSSTSLPDTLAYCIFKRKGQGPHTRGGSRGRTGRRIGLLARSLSLANACNPYCKRIPPLAQDNTSHGFPPLCFVSRQPIWARAHSDNFTRRSRDPPGSKRRQTRATLANDTRRRARNSTAARARYARTNTIHETNK
jgi:hypothetical protein